MRTKQQFLHAMGIDRWILRQDAPDVQQTEDLLEAEPATEPAAELKTDPAPKGIASETIASEATASIDSPRAPKTNAKKSSVLAETDLKTTQQEAPMPPPPRFTLALLQYEQLGLCLSLPPNNKGSDTKIPQRFCDDLARALGQNPETANCQLIEWPELDSPHIDQSMAVATDVVAHKFSALPSIVLVFGEVVKQYHPGLEALTPTDPVQIGTQRVYLYDEVSNIMHSADAKRALWHAFQERLQEGLQEGLPQTLATPEAE